MFSFKNIYVKMKKEEKKMFKRQGSQESTVKHLLLGHLAGKQKQNKKKN